MQRIFLLGMGILTFVSWGSSGGTSQPPPPPEPTLEERLADLAEHDPNPCRAETPGFEALGALG